MQVGVAFPRDGLGNDPVSMRTFAQAAESLGYAHLSIGDHVVGRAGLADSARPIVDAFVLFAHLAAVTTRLRFVVAAMPLPQRQTVLVAKQAASLDVISGGRLCLAFAAGWNALEYQALNERFSNRGRRLDEQIALLRLLWTREMVTFHGRWHTLEQAGINPLPVQRPIPIWIGGYAEPALRRAARLADGWLPHSPPGIERAAAPEVIAPTLQRLRAYLAEAGRDAGSFGVNGVVPMVNHAPDEWRRRLAGWRDLGASLVTVNTATGGEMALQEHLAALERFRIETGEPALVQGLPRPEPGGTLPGEGETIA